VDTTSTASSSTDAPGPDDRQPAEGANPQGANPEGTTPDAKAAAPTHDPERRAFFRLFGRQAAQTVAQVAGVASAVSQMPVNALTGLAELASPQPPAPLPASRPAVTPTTDAPYRSPYRVSDAAIHLLDQRRLPDAADEQLCRRGSDVAYYLRVGAARGGPLMAQLAAYGLAFSAGELRDRTPAVRSAELRRVGKALAQARVGSRMLRWAVDRAWALADALPEVADGAMVERVLRADADARAADADLDHAVIARSLEEALPRPERGALEVLIHGDPGALSAGLVGPGLTALSNRIAAGGQVRAWVTESRPGMEGARLASWELATLDIDHLVVPDTAVGALLERERIDALILAGDWIAANGDVGGLVGSRVVAGMAAMANAPVPVFVVAPVATFDPATPDGTAIPVEERPGRDLQTYATGTRLPRARVWNRGNDVIPAAWIRRIVTEMGVFEPTDAAGLTAALNAREARRPIDAPVPVVAGEVA
jgi:methylthioribose-1-phosphate isomerase